MKRIISVLFFTIISLSALSQSSGGNRGTNQAVTIQQANRNTKLHSQTAHGFTNCTLVYFNGTQFAKANANTLATSKVIGIVTNVIDANNFELTTSGYVAGCNTLTIGADYYLSATTAGTYTTTSPALPNQSVLVFKAISANELILGFLGGSTKGTVTSVTATAPLSVLTPTTTPAISIATANTTTTGALTSTDWNTFNNKANAFSGTTNFISKFTSGSSIGTSAVFDNGISVGVNTATPSASEQLAINNAVGKGTRVGPTANDGTASLLVTPNATTQIPIVLRGFAGQTADLFRVQNSALTNLFNILPNGNTGIGQTSPSQLLQVTGTNPGILVGTSTGTDGALYFGNTSHGLRRNFNGFGNDVGLYTTGGNLQFNTNGSASTQMTLTNAGNLGVGVQVPISRFNISGASGNRTNGPHFEAYINGGSHPIYQNLNWITDNISHNFDMYYNGTGWTSSGTTNAYQIHKTGGQLRFLYATSTVAGSNLTPQVGIVLNNLGNVGFGTVTPTARLEVAGSFKLVDGTQGANKILTSNATGLTSWQSNDFYRDGAKPNTIMTASGNITFSSTNFLTWTNRLIVLGGGRGAAQGVLSTNGYYDISVPPSGTVITAVGGASAITATAAGIPINQWGTLYYKLPSGSNASVATNFIFVGYTADYTVTSDMIAIASYNPDNLTLRMGTGVTLRPNTNSINGRSAIAITAYTSTATAIADATLQTGTMYTVTVGGAKQLYIK